MAGAPGKKSKFPTVRDALQFSPFSSIVPFDPDIIPAPHARPSPTKSTLSDRDKRASHELLSQLNSEATNAEKASGRLQDTLAQIQTLLNPDRLTQ